MINNTGVNKLSILYLLRDANVKFKLVMISVFLLLIIFLTLNNYVSLKNEYSSIVAENEHINKQIAHKQRLRKIAAEYAKTSLVIGQIEEKLSTKFSQAEHTRKFDSLARENHVDILSMNTRNGEAKSGYFSYVNETTFKANYPSTKKFLSSLELLPGFNSILELNLQKDSNKRLITGTLVMVTAKDAR